MNTYDWGKCQYDMKHSIFFSSFEICECDEYGGMEKEFVDEEYSTPVMKISFFFVEKCNSKLFSIKNTNVT